MNVRPTTSEVTTFLQLFENTLDSIKANFRNAQNWGLDIYLAVWDIRYSSAMKIEHSNNAGGTVHIYHGQKLPIPSSVGRSRQIPGYFGRMWFVLSAPLKYLNPEYLFNGSVIVPVSQLKQDIPARKIHVMDGNYIERRRARNNQWMYQDTVVYPYMCNIQIPLSELKRIQTLALLAEEEMPKYDRKQYKNPHFENGVFGWSDELHCREIPRS